MVGKKKLPLVIISMVMLWGSAISAEIYQWRDANGIQHFVDSPAKVPAKYRIKSKRTLNALQPTSSAKESKPFIRNEGQLSWENRCAACHFTSRGKEAGKVSLFDTLIDGATKFPASQAQVIWEFRRATDGHYSDMDAIEVSDDELELIAKYLISVQK